MKLKEAEANLQEEQARATELSKQIVRTSTCATVISLTSAKA